MAPLVRRAGTTLLVTGAALLLATGPALAAVTASTDGVDTVEVSSNAAGDAITVTCVADEPDVNGSAPTPALPCADVAFVDVDAGGGADTVLLGGLNQLSFPGLLETSVDVEDAFADSVSGSEARDVVHADGADDVTTYGGDDWVEGAGFASGGEGNDTFRDVASVLGGTGDDLIVTPGPGPLDGGGGFDTIVSDYSVFTSQQSVGLTLTDTLINGAVSTAGIEAYDITASDGERSDSIDSQGYSGRVTFHARAGADTFAGGPGADLADLGSGDDVAAPGPGSDFVLAGDGNDTVSARDGFGDVVECGPGTDTVTADRVDILSGCENISLPPPETGPVTGPKKVTKGERAFFAFGSPVAGAAFECQLDTGPFQPCTSELKVKTRRLRTGKHTVQVRAVQPAGNIDPTPSSLTFKVTKVKRPPAQVPAQQ